MADDKNNAVLAARVLSYLKRKSGDGKKPSEPETKAAAVALHLLSIALGDLASDPAIMLEKLKQLSRKGGGGSDETNHSSSASHQHPLLDYQRALAKLNQVYEMQSKIMANSHEMKKALIANIRL